MVGDAAILGTIPGWLTVAGFIAACFIFYRGGSPTAVSGLQETNRELERQIKQKEGELKALERINAELRAEKDVTVAIVPVIKAMEAHETRAQQRHDASMVVMDLIAKRLGPEPDTP